MYRLFCRISGKRQRYIINIASIQALGKTGDILNIPYNTTKSGIMDSVSLYMVT
jgi:NAD(P)-dependent dehydrogenase (short-subunit alcohol dehydrogenase family)